MIIPPNLDDFKSHKSMKWLSETPPLPNTKWFWQRWNWYKTRNRYLWELHLIHLLKCYFAYINFNWRKNRLTDVHVSIDLDARVVTYLLYFIGIPDLFNGDSANRQSLEDILSEYVGVPVFTEVEENDPWVILH